MTRNTTRGSLIFFSPIKEALFKKVWMDNREMATATEFLTKSFEWKLIVENIKGHFKHFLLEICQYLGRDNSDSETILPKKNLRLKEVNWKSIYETFGAHARLVYSKNRINVKGRTIVHLFRRIDSREMLFFVVNEKDFIFQGLILTTKTYG